MVSAELNKKSIKTGTRSHLELSDFEIKQQWLEDEIRPGDAVTQQDGDVREQGHRRGQDVGANQGNQATEVKVDRVEVRVEGEVKVMYGTLKMVDNQSFKVEVLDSNEI